MGFVYNDCEYYAFAVYDGDMYEISHYRSSGNPYVVKDLVPHARVNPSDLGQWVAANITAFRRNNRINWFLVSVDGFKIPIDDKLTFWVEKWT